MMRGAKGVHLSPLGFAACQSKKCTNVLYYGEMMRRVTYVNTTTSYNTLVH